MGMKRVELEQALEAIEPRSKAARVREVMPVIERKLAAGVLLADILAVLKTAGLEMSPATLRSYLYQFRKARAKAESALPTAPASGAASVSSVSCEPSAASPHPPTPASMPARPADTSGTPVESPSAGDARRALSAAELTRLMRPDPEQEMQDMARYEQIGKKLSRRRRDPSP